jgi:hypothetical protein
MYTIDLRELAEELEELNGRHLENEESGGLDDEELERRNALLELERDLGGSLSIYADNEPTAIAEEDFEEYAQELAEECGMIDPKSQMRHYIDWERFAEDLKHDYTQFDFEGGTYLVRTY